MSVEHLFNSSDYTCFSVSSPLRSHHLMLRDSSGLPTGLHLTLRLQILYLPTHPPVVLSHSFLRHIPMQNFRWVSSFYRRPAIMRTQPPFPIHPRTPSSIHYLNEHTH